MWRDVRHPLGLRVRACAINLLLITVPREKYGLIKGKGGIAGTGGPGTSGGDARMTLRNKTTETRTVVQIQGGRERQR